MENDLGTKTISEALFIFEFNNLLYKDIQRRLKWMQTVVDTETDTNTHTDIDPDSYPYTDPDMNPNNIDWLLLINKTTKCITKIKSINNELFEELKEITKDLPPETSETFSEAMQSVFLNAGAWRDRKLAQRRLNQKEPTLPPQDSLNGNHDQNNQDYKMALLEDIVSNMVVIKNFYSLLVDIRGELRNSLNNPKADAFIEKMTEQGYYLKETSKDLKGRLRYISYTGDNTLLQKIIT